MSAGQSFSQSFMRHMYDYGTTPEQLAMVKVIHSEHASNNPKAYYKSRVSVDDVLNSRFIVKPLHLLDCCVETDNATAIIITSADRAYDCKHTPARILSVVGRCCYKTAIEWRRRSRCTVVPWRSMKRAMARIIRRWP